ncbi:MAG: hypothetical protein ACFFDK_02345 [Promethearchaeota archaeon]
MDDFLKALQLSEDAIKIYKESLGRPPLTYYELYALLPNLSAEDFSSIINELTETDLLIQIVPQKKGVLLHYIAIPPFTPILNYYSNIHANLTNIQDAVSGLLSNSLSQIFSKNDNLELKALLTSFNEIKKDVLEDFLIQKQDSKDIFEDFEKIKSNLKKTLSNFRLTRSKLQEKVTELTQTQFSGLIHNLTRIKSVLIDNIKSLELKKKEEGVLVVIENLFKDEIRKVLAEFISNTEELIKKEFQDFEESINIKIIDPVNNLVNNAIQSGNDLNLLFLNILSKLEKTLNQIQKSIKEDQENLVENLHKVEKYILENANEIVKDSMNQVSGLSEPIENIMRQFLEKNLLSYKRGIDNVWLINSKVKINEEIVNLISNSKNNIIIILPKIENYLNLDLFQNIPENLKVKIVSSDPHTNSIVKSFKTIKNIEYRALKNENIIAMSGDDSHININVLNTESKDVLNDIAGIGSNYRPLISVLSRIINAVWVAAEPDYGHAVKEIKSIPSPFEKQLPPEKVISVTPVKQQIKTEIQHVTANVEPQTVISKEVPVTPEKIESTIQTQISSGFISKIHPKAGDQAGMMINTAFNMLLSKLNVITGEVFSKELQDVSDIILERKGFSVTLHSVRSMINKHKERDTLLDEMEKMEIFDAIEEWKQRLF